MQLRRVLVPLILVLATIAPAAQQANPAAALRAQIDRIFKDHAYDPPRFGPARWLPDGKAYAIVERSGAGTEIARYDAVSGARTVMVHAGQLVPKGSERPLDIEDYAWSPDGRRLLIFTNSRKVWRQNTRGDYWVLDTRTGTIRKLGGDGPEASMMFAKFSPGGDRVAYVRANNIYVQPVLEGDPVRLTADGTPLPDGLAWSPAVGGPKGTIVNGTSDWVNEEELGIRDGFRWSPDGQRIAYWQFDTSGVGNFTLINDTEALYPVTKTFAYPKPGTQNSRVRIGVVPASGGATTWMKTPGDQRDTYLASLAWVDANTIAMQQLNRLQSEDDYLLGSAETGDVTVVLRDRAQKGWVDAQGDVAWIDNGRAFLWLSERDGWRHLYKVAKDGGEPALLTKFDADVIRLAGVDQEERIVYFLASPSNATQSYLYRVSLDGGAPVRVTPDTQPGTHGYTMAPGAKLAFHTYSRFDRPRSMDLVSLPDHALKRGITDVASLEQMLSDVVQPPVEFLKVNIGGGVILDGWMIKPPSFDPAKKYPVIVHVYGEPASQTVTDSWGGAGTLFHRALADAGYIVVSFDNRGTPAPKGAAWRKVVYGSVGDLSSKEQAAAIRALASTHAFIDLNRVGIWGWSGGGTNTLNAMFRFPDVYAVGVAVAPVPDQRLYDTIYQERYMGIPQQNADGYRIGSAIHFAEGLRGHLLVVHGSGDDNVHYQGTERLVNRLVELGKPFDLMVYPNRTHAIAEGPGTTVHVYQLVARYFVEHLPLTQVR
jgi:dipeptidyl-peptidase-4